MCSSTNWKYSIWTPLAVHGASSGRMFGAKWKQWDSVCSSIWPQWLLHDKIMIVCLFGHITFFQTVTGTSLTPTSMLTPPLSVHRICTPLFYPINSFTIYNLFSLSSRNKKHSNKRGIKGGLFSHLKNKKDTMSVLRAYHRNLTDYLAGLVKKNNLIFHLHTWFPTNNETILVL